MNSISDNWYSTKRANTTYFYCGPSSKNENEKRVNEKQNMRMDKSKANTLIYIHMYIYTYSRIHIHIIYYSSQIVLFDIVFESIWTIHYLNWARQAVPNIGTNIKKCFCPMFLLRKGFLSLEKLFLVPILQFEANLKTIFI